MSENSSCSSFPVCASFHAFLAPFPLLVRLPFVVVFFLAARGSSGAAVSTTSLDLETLVRGRRRFVGGLASLTLSLARFVPLAGQRPLILLHTLVIISGRNYSRRLGRKFEYNARLLDGALGRRLDSLGSGLASSARPGFRWRFRTASWLASGLGASGLGSLIRLVSVVGPPECPGREHSPRRRSHYFCA